MTTLPSMCSFGSWKSDVWSFRAMWAWLLLIPSSLKRWGKSDSYFFHCIDHSARASYCEATSSPKDEWHVALLALAALHGAIQRHAGVTKREVVQPAVHVVCVAFIALEAQSGKKRKDRSFTTKGSLL